MRKKITRMIVVTGAAGFIGSCLVKKLNENGIQDLILVDDFSNEQKNKNLEGKSFAEKIDRVHFIEQWLKNNADAVSFIFHIGARTDTTEFDYTILNRLNLEYTKTIWKIAAEKNIPLVYASSAATYGLGENGYDDDESKIEKRNFDNANLRGVRITGRLDGCSFRNADLAGFDTSGKSTGSATSEVGLFVNG